MIELTKQDVQKVIRQRLPFTHKGSFGKVVLIGGNAQYGGAIIMSAEAAVRSGSGLTTVITSAKNHTALHTRCPEAIVIDWHDFDVLPSIIKSADVLLIGSGLGLSDESKTLLQLVLSLQNSRQWLVIDGSAITLFAETQDILPYPEQTVFTPHQMEWYRLSGIPIDKQNAANNQLVQQKLKALTVVKGHRTEIYAASNIYKNPLGSPAMATGGMGDVLAGMITSFLGQFDQKVEAVCAAVFLHSFIGESLARHQYVVLPTEISYHLPEFMKRFERPVKRKVN